MVENLEKLTDDLLNKEVSFVNGDNLSKGHYCTDIDDSDLMESTVSFTIYDEHKYGDGEVYTNINFNEITKITVVNDNTFIIEQTDADDVEIIFS